MVISATGIFILL